MYTLIVKTSFEAAHSIPGYDGKCERVHGHSYHVEAEFSGRELNSIGMLCDFSDLKAVLNDFLPDHTYLNEVFPFSTTVENLSRWIFEQLQERGLPVTAVTLRETEKNACRYTPD